MSAGLTLTSQFVLKEPWVGGGVAVGLNVGHEIGQARVRHRWTADNTRDLVGGTVTAVVASLLLHRYVATPPRPEAAGLRPLTPSASLRSWYERLAQCLARPSLFPQVRWFTSTADSSHQHVVVLNADSVTSVSAVTRSLLPHFERSDDRERNAAATRCLAEKQHPPL